MDEPIQLIQGETHSGHVTFISPGLCACCPLLQPPFSHIASVHRPHFIDLPPAFSFSFCFFSESSHQI